MRIEIVSRVSLCVLAGLLVVRQPVLAQEAAACQDLITATDLPTSSLKKKDLLEAACPDRAACTRKCKGNDDERSRVFASYGGSFACPGRAEKLVSLVPCNYSGKGDDASSASIVLLQGTAAGWRRAADLEGQVLEPKECRVEKAGTRNVLLCKSTWGPLQGIMGASMCLLYSSGGELNFRCPLRVMTDPGGDESSELPPDYRIGEIKFGDLAPSGRIPITVKVDKRPLVFELDDSGARLSAKSKANLKRKPLKGLYTDEP